MGGVGWGETRGISGTQPWAAGSGVWWGKTSRKREKYMKSNRKGWKIIENDCWTNDLEMMEESLVNIECGI